MNTIERAREIIRTAKDCKDPEADLEALEAEAEEDILDVFPGLFETLFLALNWDDDDDRDRG